MTALVSKKGDLLVRQIALLVHQRTKLGKQTSLEAVNATFKVLKDELMAGNSVKIYSFGTFSISKISRKVGLDEGELGPDRYKIVFRASDRFTLDDDNKSSK